MDIGFLWDENKEALVQEKHNVNLEQAVEALIDPHHLYEQDPQYHYSRFMIVGQTREGRILQVIVSDEEIPVMRLITAFDAEPKWRTKYEQR